MLRAVRKQFVEFEQLQFVEQLVQFLQLQFVILVVIFVIGQQQFVRAFLVEFERREQLVQFVVVQ